MTFLSSFRIGSDTVYPEALRIRLRNFPLLSDVSDTGLKKLLGEANWFGLPGGMLLEREGENERALFLVVTGALGVFVEDEHGMRKMVAHIPAGETVGEMSLISGEAHSAQLVALRDSELLRLHPRAFDALITRHPRVMFNLMRILVKRLQRTTQGDTSRARPRTFAIIPLQDGLDHEPIAHQLSSALISMGSHAAVLDSSAADQSAEWFANFEAGHDTVFYRGDAPDSAWTHLCLRQADRIFLLARSDRPLPQRPLDMPAFKERATGLPQLLLIHPQGTDRDLPKHFALRSGLFESHHHMRAGRNDDIKRLARFIAGRAVGVVLGGGGARGFAHIGVIKALMEAGVPIDHLGGTSMGALVAAGIAMEWSIEELAERMRHAFVDNNPLSDYTFPLIALVRGKKVARMLRESFGDINIEQMPKPFFCVSSDLTLGRSHVHRGGPLWQALRSTVALPGILPPVRFHNHLLVDGGVMNNLPVDVMAETVHGPIIASDVTGEFDVQIEDEFYGERSLWWMIREKMRGTPSILSILMRSGTVGSEAQRKVVREQADYLFEPPLNHFGLRDWDSFDRAITVGYLHAKAQIEQKGIPVTDIWTDGPAVARPINLLPKQSSQ